MNKALKSIRGVAAATIMAVMVQGLGSVALGPAADARDGEVTATTRVHVRSGPSTSSTSLTILDRGDSLPSQGSVDGWTKVTYKGKTAYVFSRYLTGSTSSAPSSETSNGTKESASGAVRTTANLNLRSGPSLRDSVRFVAPRGTSLKLLGKSSGEYVQVEYKGQTLWASDRYLTDADAPAASSGNTAVASGKGRATAPLMIRNNSSKNFRNIVTVPRGTILDTTGKTENGMAEVLYKGTARWVNAKYLAPITDKVAEPSKNDTPSTATSERFATTLLNVWTASTGTKYVREIPRGTAVQVTGTVENGRAAIIDDGVTRWVTARYLSTTAPSAAPAQGGNSESLNRGYSSGLDKTNANVQAIARDVWDRFPAIKTQYGWRRDVTPDHPAGRAVDVMIPSYKANQALGWEIAEYYRANAKKYNINYIIFGQKIWSVQRNKEGWRWMADRGSDNANHYNHVHINTYG